MIKKVNLIALAIFLMSVCLSFSSFEQAPAPLPPNVTVDPPDPSLPVEVRSLSGKWAGKWNSRWDWDCVLYVENVDKDSAQLVHSWGEYTTSRQSCHCVPNWARIQAAKVNYSQGQATLEFSTPNLQRFSRTNHSHMLTGTVAAEDAERDSERGFSGSRHGRGQYDFTFTVEQSEPNIMRGHFVSGNASQLRIEMKRIE